MSLIFEALKKLEREKDAPDRGVVVVGPGAWGEREPRSRGRTLAAVALVALGITLAAFALRPRVRAPEAPKASPAAAGHDAASPASAISASGSGAAARSTAAPPPAPRLVLPTAPGRKEPVAETAPTETSSASPAPEPEFRLNAISIRDGHPVALLNDRLVREGDVIEGVRVLHIGEDFVELEVRGERKTIRF